MEKERKNTRRNKGITLIALVITIVILLILAGISIAQLTGNGLFENTKEAKERALKEEATEMIKLKIENIRISTYMEKQEMPTLQDLANGFCEDEEIEYVKLETQKQASLEHIEVGETETIFVKLKKYPYEFEINSSIQIAGIDGITINDDKQDEAEEGDITDGKDNNSDGDEQEQGNQSTQNSTMPANDITEAKKDDMFDKTVNSLVQDEYENQVVVPAGFKITEDANNVTQGMVIEDREGNQFVWIPVGEVKGKAETDKKTIKLSRYIFDISNGKESDMSGNKIGSSVSFQELAESNKGNAVAKNLEEFKTSVDKYKGYYIGRYEGRKDSSGMKVTEKATDKVWYQITQGTASTNCQSMYSNNSNFTSDLINSYAWDTAIVFIQKFSEKTRYSSQTRVSTTLSSTGTYNNEISQQDEVCNIYDMASNVREWTTETCLKDGYPCTARGGASNIVNGTTDNRAYYSVTYQYGSESVGFRPLLYCSTES